MWLLWHYLLLSVSSSGKEEVKNKLMMIVWWFFLLTLVIELPVVVYFFKMDWRNALVPFFLINLFTWPLLHFLLISSTIDINILETGVAITESIGYRLLTNNSWKRCLLTGVIANGLSYGIGILINSFLQ